MLWWIRVIICQSLAIRVPLDCDPIDRRRSTIHPILWARKTKPLNSRLVAFQRKNPINSTSQEYKVPQEKYVVVVNPWGLPERLDNNPRLNEIGIWFQFLLKKDYPEARVREIFYQRTVWVFEVTHWLFRFWSWFLITFSTEISSWYCLGRSTLPNTWEDISIPSFTILFPQKIHVLSISMNIDIQNLEIQEKRVSLPKYIL